MNIYKLLQLFDGVVPLDVGWFASNAPGVIQSKDDLEVFRQCREQPPVGAALVAYRLLGQRGRDHAALTQLDDRQTKLRLYEMHGRAVIYLERSEL